MSIDDMFKQKEFEQKEIKKIIPVKNTWHDWLVNYIPKPLLNL